MNVEQLIELTSSLMTRARIPLRDTYTVGDAFEFEWSDTAVQASGTSSNVRTVPGCQSVAYGSYRVVVPRRYLKLKRLDPAVHECVHFLQHQTYEEEKAYFSAQPTDRVRYLQYLSQRVEVEAHFVQLL
jgi:hypothetical protein